MDINLKKNDELFELIGKESHSRETQKELLSEEVEKVLGAFQDFKSSQEGKFDQLSESVKSSLGEEATRMDGVIDEKISALSDHFKKEIDKLDAGTLTRSQFADLLAGLAEEIAPKKK